MTKSNFAVLALGAVFAFAAAALPAGAAIKTQTVDYKIGNDTFEGFLAYDDAAKGKRPGVVVYPAWTGIGDNEREHAERLAKEGYVAFVADIYGKGIHPKPPQESGMAMKKYIDDRNLYREHVKAGLDQLSKNPMVDAQRIAAIGYCFGAVGALELARSGAAVKDVVLFHVSNVASPTPADDQNIKAHVLVLQGQDDPNTPPDKTTEFEKNMEAAHVDLQYVAYSGTAHCYTDAKAGNDMSHGCAYNAESEKRSWQAMHDLFQTTLR
jgi:dienelactone hydrolase